MKQPSAHEHAASKLTIHRHPRLGAWLVSSTPAKSYLTAVLPISAALLAVLAAVGGDSNRAVLVLAFILGVMQWTLLEYVIHRWIYHRPGRARFRSFVDSLHHHHHANLDDPHVLNAGPLLVYPTVTTVGLADWLLSGLNPVLTAALLLGTLWAYAFYEWTHFRIHFRPERTGYWGWIQRYHLHHHYRSNRVCYGNTSSLWDHVFRTYDPRHRQFDVTTAPAGHFHGGPDRGLRRLP